MSESAIPLVKHLLVALAIICLSACTPTPSNPQLVGELPPMYPDYADVTIPCNIAPLNFLLRGDFEAVEMRAVSGAATLRVNARGNEVCIPVGQWKDFLQQVGDGKVDVTVSALEKGQWRQFKSFSWQVTTDEVDPYLTYRLIEPDYEIYQNLSLHERCVEDFNERAICDYGLVGNRCMNCHVYGSQSSDLSMLYVRGEGGGAILNRKGQLSKLDIKADGMVSGSVYYGFSPDGRHIAFSSNVIIPAFHARPEKRLEVFDKSSDVYVADLERHRIIRSALLSDSTAFETFPAFSPDGKYVYFCSAPSVKLPGELQQMRYSLCRIGFDAGKGAFGDSVDTLYAANRHGRSVSHPRVSPDGKWLVYTVTDYGTFPIWHQESDLAMLRLETGETDDMAVVNSDMSDTYHSWSSNSRWLVFASKRDDHLYGKPYFCYIDRQGRASKPFVLPQRDPQFYDFNLKSFNVPELGRGRLPFSADDVRQAMGQKAIAFQ